MVVSVGVCVCVVLVVLLLVVRASRLGCGLPVLDGGRVRGRDPGVEGTAGVSCCPLIEKLGSTDDYLLGGGVLAEFCAGDAVCALPKVSFLLTALDGG